MDWLNFGNFQDNGGRQPNEDELFKQVNTPEIHQSLADYMNTNYGDKGNGPMPTDLPNKHDDTQKYMDLFKAIGNTAPSDTPWYNSGIYAHKAGMSLGSIIGML